MHILNAQEVLKCKANWSKFIAVGSECSVLKPGTVSSLSSMKKPWIA